MSDQLNIKKQLLDQSAHMVAALVFLSPVIAAPCLLSAMFAGAGMGIVREVTEGGSKVTLETIKGAFTKWSCVDISFWAIGAGIAWSLFG